jgi:hypothetical protein
MSITIIVNIEAGDGVNCGKCKHDNFGLCGVFGGKAVLYKPGQRDQRCPACLAGEQKLAALIQAGQNQEAILDEAMEMDSDWKRALAAIKEP